jgi:hypothetical protein
MITIIIFFIIAAISFFVTRLVDLYLPIIQIIPPIIFGFSLGIIVLKILQIFIKGL